MIDFDLIRDPGADPAKAEQAARSLGAGAVWDLSLAAEAEQNPFEQVWEPPGPIADAFYWSDAAVCMLRGPVGSGKTTSNMRKPIRRAIGIPRSTIDGWRRYKVVIARHTFRQLWNTTIPSYLENISRKTGTWAGGRGDPVSHTIIFEDDDGPIEYIAEFQAFGESEQEIYANIRGVQTTDFAFEEADTLHQVMFTTALGRINRYPRKDHYKGGEFHPYPYPEEQWGYGQINMTYNAPDEENWTVRLEELEDDDTPAGKAFRDDLESANAKVDFYRQPGGTEPGAENMKNLDRDYYSKQRLLMKAQGRGDMITRLIDNKIGFIKEGDLVFETHYNSHTHVSREYLEPHPHMPLRIGLDQGFFGAAVICQFVPPFQWRVLRELWFKQKVFAADFGEALRDLLDDEFPGLPVEGIWSDMAGEQGSAITKDQGSWNESVARVLDIDVTPQLEGHNRIEPRLNVIRAMLDHIYRGQPGLLIDPRCKLLIRGFEAKYVWEREDDKATGKSMKPKKRGNRSADVMDALGYVGLSERDGMGHPIIEGVPVRPGQTDGRDGLIGHNRLDPISRAQDAQRLTDWDPQEHHERVW